MIQNQPIQKTETAPFGPDSVLSCTIPKCGSRFVARAAFNKPVDLRSATREDALKNVVCDTCARHIGTRNKLLVTLDIIDQRAHNKREHRDIRQWAERGARQREQEARNAGIANYATWLAETDKVSATGKDGNVFPKVVEHQCLEMEQHACEGDKSGLGCGLPRHLRCCDGRRAAKDFIVLNGVTIGLCGLGGFIFRQVRKDLRNHDRHMPGLNRLRTHEKPEEAEIIAAHDRGEHEQRGAAQRGLRTRAVAVHTDCPICTRTNNRGPRR